MVAGGLGMTVVPRNCVDESQLKYNLKVYDLARQLSKNMNYIVI